MPKSKNPFGFTTPKRKKSKSGINLLDLANVEKWIKNLPMGNAGQSAYLLNLDIKSKNRMELDFEDRLEYLELIRDPLFHINGIMENYFVGVNFPLTVRQQNIATACRDFHYLMTLGYIIAIEELFEQTKRPTSNNKLGLIIHRAITYLSRVILISYQVYVPVANTIWEKLNKLFLFAEENKIDKIQILDNQHQHISKTTVVGEYTRVIFLTLAKPYHLRNGEVSNIYINLERWLRLITPSTLKNTKKNIADFAINLQRDAPPHFRELDANKLSTGRYRLFNTNELIKEIDLELERSELITSNTLISANLADASLGHGLLLRLKQAWTEVPSTKIKSNRINKPVELVIGISAIYETLINSEAIRLFDKGDQKSLQNNFNLYFEEITDCDVTDIEYIKLDSTCNTAAIDDEDRKQVPDNKPVEQKATLKQANWELVKQSPDEYYLKCKIDCIQQIQVGEIVGIRHITKKNDEVKIAIISWLKTNGVNGIIFGAKPISPSAIPIEIEMLANNSNKQLAQHAILLPEIKKMNQCSSIITYPAPFRMGSLVSIKINDKNIPLKLMDGVENSGLYNRFQYDRLVSSKKRKIASKKINKTKPKTKKSTSVWNCF